MEFNARPKYSGVRLPNRAHVLHSAEAAAELLASSDAAPGTSLLRSEARARVRPRVRVRLVLNNVVFVTAEGTKRERYYISLSSECGRRVALRSARSLHT